MTYLGRRLGAWAAASNERAVANARGAATLCSRRRVEREEAALYLDALASRRSVSATGVAPETAPAVVVDGVDSLSG